MRGRALLIPKTFLSLIREEPRHRLWSCCTRLSSVKAAKTRSRVDADCADHVGLFRIGKGTRDRDDCWRIEHRHTQADEALWRRLTMEPFTPKTRSRPRKDKLTLSAKQYSKVCFLSGSRARHVHVSWNRSQQQSRQYGVADWVT